MTDKTIDLDGRRGMEAQKATDLRRLLAEVEANERSLRLRQDELEAHLAGAPASSWKPRRRPAMFSASMRQRWPPKIRAGELWSRQCLGIWSASRAHHPNQGPAN